MPMIRPLRLAVAGLLTAVPVSLAAQAPAADPLAGTGFVKEFGTMWTFDAPPLAYWKARYGFTPDQAWLDHVRLSAVRIPGCSASFVSDRGLVMTNHHCARACITAASSQDSSYQATGFVARTDAEEKACTGMTADQLESIEDVTARVRRAVTARSATERVAQRDAAIEAIQAECGAATGLTCQVVTLYQGGMYSLYRFRRYTDLRLVMAPEEAISFFGGDPDNFTYPRYDLDVTFLRVYQNGEPLRPAHWLRWNPAGVGAGDLVFVLGNPGSTGRLLTLAQMEYLRDVQYPAQLRLVAASIQAYKRLAAAGPEAHRRYENTIFSLENTQKAVTGYRRGLLDLGIMARKKAFEDDFRRRIAARPDLRARYGGAWDLIAGAQRELASFATEARFHDFAGGSLLGIAGNLVLLPGQSALADPARLPLFRGEGLSRVRAQALRNQTFDLAAEEALLAAQLELAAAALPTGDPVLQAALRGRTPAEAAKALIDGTGLTSLEARRALADGGASAVAASEDPLIVLARTIAPSAVRHGMRQARLNAVISSNAELVGQAIFAAYGTALPPDATFSLRISDGVVGGFPMNGTIAPWRTSFYGLFGRNAEFDDQPPFHLPDQWKMALGRLDLAAPVNFVSSADIIGGNSGSPVVNRAGEVVGVVFDGNMEMLPNRFIYTDEVARSVSVHAAAIGEALVKVYGGGRIAAELERAAVPR